MKSVSHIVLATLVASGAALAQEVDFAAHDTDGDGYLSDAEWSAVAHVSSDFATLDADGDGRLSETEVNAGTGESTQGVSAETGATTEADPTASDPTASDPTATDISAGSEQSAGEQATMQGTAGEETAEGGMTTAEDSGQGASFDRSSYEGDDGTRLRADFEARDANGDGMLDEAEATEDWIDINLFEKSDVNDDGLIDFGEAEDGFMEIGDEDSVTDDLTDETDTGVDENQ